METSPTLSSLYRQYLDALPKIGVHTSSSGAEWTRHIKVWWAKKGIEYSFQVWANGFDLKYVNFHKREFMVDLLWEVDNERVAKMQMASECEWDMTPDEILWDFCKLVYVKAGQKVMIFQVSSRQEDDDIVNELSGLVKRCRIKQEPAEQYLLIRHKDYWPEPNRLIQLMRGYIVEQDGSCKTLGKERKIIIS